MKRWICFYMICKRSVTLDCNRSISRFNDQSVYYIPPYRSVAWHILYPAVFRCVLFLHPVSSPGRTRERILTPCIVCLLSVSGVSTSRSVAPSLWVGFSVLFRVFPQRGVLSSPVPDVLSRSDCTTGNVTQTAYTAGTSPPWLPASPRKHW